MSIPAPYPQNWERAQSTLARELATILDLPCILLDTLHWTPGWGERSAEEFRTIVRAAMDQDPRGWVIDGNYTSKLGTIVSDEATDIICQSSSRIRRTFRPVRARC